MFYADFLFVKRGPLSKVWQVAHLAKKLSRRDIKETNVVSAVHAIEQPQAPLALRSQGQLLLGLVRIYDGQVRYLQQDCTEAAAKLTSLMERRGRGGPHMEADAAQLVAPAGAITVSEREMAMDGYDALEEQRYLEAHAMRLSSSHAQAPSSPYPSLSLSLSASQLTPLTLTQSQQRLSQQARPADLSLEQARRTGLSLGPLDDFELGEGMALEDEGIHFSGADMELEGPEPEVARDEGVEMGRVSDQLLAVQGLDDEQRRQSLLSFPGTPADAQQLALDAELIRRREERRLQRKRLRFAGALRDEQVELAHQDIRAMLASAGDLVMNRTEVSLVNPRRVRERLIAEGNGLAELLGRPAVLGRTGDRQLDELMEQLFSIRGLPQRGAEEAAGEAEAALDELAAADFRLGLDETGEGAVERPYTPQLPASPAREPQSPSTAPLSIPPSLPPPSRSDLEERALSDEAASTSLHTFFNDPESSAALDSSTLESRTVKTLSLLSSHYQQHGSHASLSFRQLAAPGKVGRGVAAGLFYQLLVLGQAGAIRAQQREEGGEITVRRGDRFDEVVQRLTGSREEAGARAAKRRGAARA